MTREEELHASLDWAYRERNRLVVLLAQLALERGWAAGRYFDREEQPKWNNVVVIDLPTGQISFHVMLEDCVPCRFDALPAYQGTWDGHTSDEKWERVLKLVDLLSKVEK